MAQLNKKQTFKLIAFLLSASSLSHAQSPKQLVEPENRPISIHGTIRLVHDYGPPGYGEDPKHDAHVSYWALETPIPINTQCTPEKTDFSEDCSATKRMKLFFQGGELKRLSELPAARWNDRSVIVHGKIHRADTAGEMTVIYMDVSDIAPARP